MTGSLLTRQDLQARGWTLGMIRTLVDPHDDERSTNRLGRQIATPIRLYLEARVRQLETTPAFS